MIAWIALAVSFPGFALLSVAMDRHGQDVLGRSLPPPLRRASRIGGALLLAVALAVCVQTQGASIGTAEWFGVLSLAAMGVGLTLTYAPRRLAPLAGASLTLGAVLGLVAAVS